MRILLYASGFDRPFNTENAELRCGTPSQFGGNPNCEWSPSSVDLKALAKKSGGHIAPIANIKELVDFLKKQPNGSIKELRLLGHSNKRIFAFGGTITSSAVRFAEPAMIANSRTFLTAQPQLRKLRNRFTEKGQVTLAGCGSGGIGGPLLELVSESFRTCAYGFQRPIQYDMGGTTSGAVVRNSAGKPIGRRISASDGVDPKRRGTAAYNTATLAFEDLFGSDSVPRSVFHSNAWKLQPDVHTCTGQPLILRGAHKTTKSIFNAVARSSRSPIDARHSAFLVGWQLINLFHDDRADLVAGVGYEEKLKGLRVVQKKNKELINVGKPFVQSISQRSLKKRAAEMGKALKMIADGKKGVVPMS